MILTPYEARRAICTDLECLLLHPPVEPVVRTAVRTIEA
jgi:hypothetical protein